MASHKYNWSSNTRQNSGKDHGLYQIHAPQEQSSVSQNSLKSTDYVHSLETRSHSLQTTQSTDSLEATPKPDQTAQEEHTSATKAKSNTTHEPKPVQISWCKSSITINGKTHTLPTTKEYILYEYADIFKGGLTLYGIKVDLKKIETIMHMDSPQNVASLQSFNDMVNYLKKFSPVLSELSEPLRRLCKSGAKWAWESEQQNTFESIKQVITSLPVLSCFDKIKKHTIQCDASKKGLGAVLLQESKPVVYVSRALTKTEQRYSNIERELLAIVFALKRLNHNTFGRTITVQSDHQPQQSTNSKGKESDIDIIPIHHITQSVPVSKTRLQELRLAT